MSDGSSAYVWIKLATAREDAFAKIFCPPGADASDVATLACASLGWGLTANKVHLYMLAAAGPKPQLPAPEAFKDLEPLSEEAVLEGAGVTSGAWLVAVPTTPCGPGGGGDAVASLGRPFSSLPDAHHLVPFALSLRLYHVQDFRAASGLV